MSRRGSGRRSGKRSDQQKSFAKRDGKSRSARSERYFVCGINAFNQLYETDPDRLIEVFLLENLGRERMQRLAIDPNHLVVPVQQVDEDHLFRLAGTDSHQGIVAAIKPPAILDDNGALELLEGIENPLILVLDSCQDPRNFGACLRTAEAAGVDLVVIPRSRSPELTPTVSKVASGAAEVQKIARVSNLARFLRELQDAGVWLVGTDGEAEGSLYEQSLTGPTALVMGAEGEGMRRLTAEHCDLLVKLPLLGTVESLNLSVATGIGLYEILRQRGTT